MFYGITDLSAFILGTIFIVLLPGPNSLYVMTVATRHGIAAGYRGACGIFIGDTILMILSVAGVATLLKTNPGLFMAVKYLGAAYLAWLGSNLLRAAVATWRQEKETEKNKDSSQGPTAAVDASKPLKTALLISLTNPKAILFFVSFFIQFVAPDYPHPLLSFLILGVVVQLCSAAYLSALIFGGTRLAQRFRRQHRLAATASGLTGALFVGFAVKLASATLA